MHACKRKIYEPRLYKSLYFMFFYTKKIVFFLSGPSWVHLYVHTIIFNLKALELVLPSFQYW